MAIKATPYDLGYRDILGKRSGARVSVADDAVSVSIGTTGLWRIGATSDCQVDFGPDATVQTATDHGEPWPAGHVEVRLLDAADKIAVKAGL